MHIHKHRKQHMLFVCWFALQLLCCYCVCYFAIVSRWAGAPTLRRGAGLLSLSAYAYIVDRRSCMYVCMYVCIYIYREREIYVYTYVYIYIYILYMYNIVINSGARTLRRGAGLPQ